MVCGAGLLLASSLIANAGRGVHSLLIERPLYQVTMTIILGLSWQLSIACVGCDRTYEVARLSKASGILAKGALLASCWAAVWLYLVFGVSPMSLPGAGGLLVFLLTSFSGMFAMRLIARAVRSRRETRRNVLFIGSNTRAIILADQLTGQPGSRYCLAGFIDEAWHCQDAPEYYKQKLLGTNERLLDLLRTLALDEVILTLPIASNYWFAKQVTSWCEQQGIPVRCDASLFKDPQQSVRSADSHPELLTLYEADRRETLVGSKRAIDFILSLAALFAMLPVLVGIALAIRATSSGPVIYSQERLGKGKRRFRMHKFRTMVQNADALVEQMEHLNESCGPTFKVRQDPRVTAVGRVLRKTSLDELPQLVNVLLGDMSLVGPRPLPLRDYKGFSVDWHRRRFSVKPGMTGTWQVSGRSTVTFEHWMQMDVDYIDNWSMWLDVQILLQTIPAVLRGHGAM